VFLATATKGWEKRAKDAETINGILYFLKTGCEWLKFLGGINSFEQPYQLSQL